MVHLRECRHENSLLRTAIEAGRQDTQTVNFLVEASPTELTYAGESLSELAKKVRNCEERRFLCYLERRFLRYSERRLHPHPILTRSSRLSLVALVARPLAAEGLRTGGRRDSNGADARTVRQDETLFDHPNLQVRRVSAPSPEARSGGRRKATVRDGGADLVHGVSRVDLLQLLLRTRNVRFGQGRCRGSLQIVLAERVQVRLPSVISDWD